MDRYIYNIQYISIYTVYDITHKDLSPKDSGLNMD